MVGDIDAPKKWINDKVTPPLNARKEGMSLDEWILWSSADFPNIVKFPSQAQEEIFDTWKQTYNVPEKKPKPPGKPPGVGEQIIKKIKNFLGRLF